jgi:HEAT repeat protein
MSQNNKIIQRASAILGCFVVMCVVCPAVAVETTAQTLEAAKSKDTKTRYTAIDDLGERHEQASQVVPELTKMLQDNDPQVRWRTARTLGEYGELAKSTADGLRKLLGDNDPIVQYHAAIALGKVEDKSDETVEALVVAAGSNDPRVARAAIAAIRNLHPGPKKVAEVLGKALKSNDHALKLNALEAIVEQGSNATPFLKEALKNPETAYLAATAIEKIGPDSAETAPDLAAILGKTKHSKMLIQTLLALASIGPAAAPTSAQITPLLESSTDATVPVAAAFALGSIGAKDSDSALKAAAKKDNPFLQMMAVWAIAKVHPEDEAATKAALEKLTQSLKSTDPAIRGTAAKSIFSLHAPPEVLAPYLVVLINDPDPGIQQNVIDAAASLGEQVVPRLNNGLKNPQLRKAAVRVIKKLGPKAGEAVAPLMEVAKDDPKMKTDVQLALDAIGPAAAPATDMLVNSLSSKDAAERESALYALRKIGPGAKAAIKPLSELMKSDSAFDGDAAAWALARIAPRDAQVAAAVLPRLVKELSSADEQTRAASIQALVDLGATGKVTAELQRVAKDDASPNVRAAAAAALKN